MAELTELQKQQLAWAIAWQDHGDSEALALLCASVEPFAIKWAGKKSFGDQDLRDELLAEFRVAIVEAASLFDRERADGFVSLCALLMKSRQYRPIQHKKSPATVRGRSLAAAERLSAYDSDEEEQGVAHLRAPDPHRTIDLSLAHEAIQEAGLSEREMMCVCRYEQGLTREALGKRLGISKERVRQIEDRAMRRVKAVLSARGLGLDDLL